MNVQKAEEKDLQEIHTLQYLAYQSEAELLNNPHIPPLEQTIDEVKREFSEGVFLKVVDENGVIIGSVRASSDGQTLFIGKLIVHPDHQGQGIGTRLLAAMETIAPHPRYELFTSTKSARNIRLYERLGYSVYREKAMSDDLKFVYLEKLA